MPSLDRTINQSVMGSALQDFLPPTIKFLSTFNSYVKNFLFPPSTTQPPTKHQPNQNQFISPSIVEIDRHCSVYNNASNDFKTAPAPSFLPQCSNNASSNDDGHCNNAFLNEANTFRPVIDIRPQDLVMMRQAPQAMMSPMSSFSYDDRRLRSSSYNSSGSSSYSIRSNNSSGISSPVITVRHPSPRCATELPDSPSSFNSMLAKHHQHPNHQNHHPQVFDNKKKKTELCKHYQKAGVCPYGEGCNYAHGEQDRVSFGNVEEMAKAGVIADARNYMCRPCVIFVSTGSW